MDVFFILLLLGLFPLVSHAQRPAESLAKFEPPDGTCLFFIGQDLEATGGLYGYEEGYCDFFDAPAGVTIYTNLASGGESYGYRLRGLDGLRTKANWGAGDACAQCYLQDSTYRHSLLAIGLSMVDYEKAVAQGKQDRLIRELGDWIKAADRPVFLRIGYEFDGWDWNHYRRRPYLKAWRRIHDLFAEMQVDNVALVWQSKGSGSGQEVLEQWYPGDELVDWCGYSYFGQPDTEMITFARKRGKPVFIAEATPVVQRGSLYFSADLKQEEVARRVWQDWFVPFIETLHAHQDIVKAFSYINVDWPSQPMWVYNPTFQKVDSRIQASPFVSARWLEEVSKPRYLKPSADLWRRLASQ